MDWSEVWTPEIEVYARVGLAILIGLILGLERGWHMRELADGKRAAGARTFALIGLLGGLSGLLAEPAGPALVPVALGVLGIMLYAAYQAETHHTGSFGMTTEIAAVATFLLGVMATRGDPTLAAAVTAVVLFVLDVKDRLHRFIASIEMHELRAAIKLLLISAVLLPVLPDEDYGPGGVWNPYQLWWIVVLIAGLSFGGYVLVRLAGPRTGPALMGALGGLASSTAVTLGAARMARRAPDHSLALAAAIALASGVMAIRVLVVAGALAPGLALSLASAMVPFAVVAGGFGLWLARGPAIPSLFGGTSGDAQTAGDARLQLENPAEIGAAIWMAVLIAGVSLIAHYAQQWLPQAGLILTGAVSGLADVDAVTVAAARTGDAGSQAARWAVLAAVTSNTLVKAGMATAIGGARLARPVIVLTVLALSAGAAGALLAPLVLPMGADAAP